MFKLLQNDHLSENEFRKHRAVNDYFIVITKSFPFFHSSDAYITILPPIDIQKYFEILILN